MTYSKEELLALLNFIKKVCGEDENKWFKEELIKELGCQQNDSPALLAFGDGLNSRVSDIEKYLGLDYKLDHAKSIIDYSRIKDSQYRDFLIQDNREMLRYRLNCRGHFADFLEFCKFAHFQNESLINYYYQHQGTFDVILELIEKYLPEKYHIIDKDKKQKVSDIAYYDKKIAFCNQFNSASDGFPLGYIFNEILDFIRRARNDVNHRSGERNQESIDYYKKVILKSGLPSNDTDFDTYKINSNPYQKERFDKEYRYSKKYIDYKYSLWLKNTPYSDVIATVSKLAEVVQSVII